MFLSFCLLADECAFWYCFKRAERVLGAQIEAPKVHNVRNIAPGKDMFCISFQLPFAAATGTHLRNPMWNTLMLLTRVLMGFPERGYVLGAANLDVDIDEAESKTADSSAAASTAPTGTEDDTPPPEAQTVNTESASSSNPPSEPANKKVKRSS